MAEQDELRVLVIAPTGRDSALTCRLLQRANIACQAHRTCEEAYPEIASGVGTVILAEETLNPELVREFERLISQQPSWSDFPLILLTLPGQVSISSQRRSALRVPLGNVLLLERPVRPETLMSTVQAALRARRRQYQIRDHLEQSRRAEEALRKSEKLAVAGRMAASIAHEINNPLEAVTNLLYLIEHSDSAEVMHSYAELAQRELSRVSEIAIQTLKFYRQPSIPSPVHVSEEMDSVLKLYQGRFLANNVRVEKRYGRDTTIHGHGSEWRQVLANLVSNALDAIRQGGRLLIRVRPSFEHAKGRRPGVRVTIADTGTGVPQELKPKIFEPFVTTKETTGTGLGLWVSAEIIRKNGGLVRLRTCVAPGRSGTVFMVFLPQEHRTAAEAESAA